MTMTGRAIDPNNQAMRPRAGPNWHALRRDRELLREFVRLLDNGVIDELERRCEQISNPDGYPRTSMGSGVSGGSPDTSVEAAALHGLPGDTEQRREGEDPDNYGGLDPPDWAYVPDWSLKLLTEMAEQMAQATTLLTGRREGAWRKAQAVLHVGDSLSGRRATGGDCAACDVLITGAVDDRMRSGFCEACYRAWCRFRKGKSEEQGALRRQFISQRREDLRGKMDDGKAAREGS